MKHVAPVEFGPNSGEADLIATAPAASPPLFIAIALVALSIAGPFIFLADGTPSLWLGVTAVAVALAGMITMLAAIRAQLRRRADAAARRRVSISVSGITFYRTPAPKDIEHFPWQDIASLHLAATTFILQAGPDAPKPGRHAIRFGKLVTPRSAIISAMDAGQAKIRGAS